MPRVDLQKYNKKVENPVAILWRLVCYFKHCRLLLTAAMLSILAYVAATIGAAYCMKPLTNLLEASGAAPNETYAKYISLILGLAGLYLLSALTNYLLNRLMLECSAIIMKQLRTELFDTMQRQPVRFFDENKTGALMSYYTSDIEATNELLQHSITQLAISITSLLGTIGMMLALSMRLFAIMVVLGAIVVLVVRVTTRISKRTYASQQRLTAAVSGYMEEMITGQRDVKVFTHEKEVMEQFDVINRDLCKASTTATTVTSMVGPILNNLSHIFYAITCAVGVLWLTGEGAGGILIGFLQYVRTFADRVSQISEQFNALMMALAGAERIFAILDLPSEEDQGQVTLEQNGDDYSWRLPDGALVPLRGDVRFAHVDFSYEDDVKILDDVSFDIKPGETIALVGPTGAGKTTIVNLISRFYDIQNGHIRIDGHDIRQVTIESLRQQMGIMTQDNFLFTGTIRDNIRYGKLDATEEEIIAAAKAVHAHDFITDLKDGYDTMLTERGGGLSVGQKQLLAFARTMVSNPNILILDEATSSIDTQTELLVQEGIDALLKGRTSFVIAHRLSTIQKADRIFVIDHGGIVEEGSASELLAKKGAYYRLHNAQLKFS